MTTQLCTYVSIYDLYLYGFVTSACALYVYGQHLESEFNIIIIIMYSLTTMYILLYYATFVSLLYITAAAHMRAVSRVSRRR